MVTAVNPFSFLLLVLITIGRVEVSASNTNKIKIGADIGRRCFCPATTQFIRPRVAQNKDGQIAFIMNNPEFSQRVKIVICKEEPQSRRERSKRREGREAGAFKNFQRWSCRFSLEEMENK